MEEIKIYQGLWRYQYRYRHIDNVHYILAFFEVGLDGIDRAKWSLYYDKEEQPILEQTCRDEDFQNMIISEEWQREGYDVVVAK